MSPMQNDPCQGSDLCLRRYHGVYRNLDETDKICQKFIRSGRRASSSLKVPQFRPGGTEVLFPEHFHILFFLINILNIGANHLSKEIRNCGSRPNLDFETEKVVLKQRNF